VGGRLPHVHPLALDDRDAVLGIRVGRLLDVGPELLEQPDEHRAFLVARGDGARGPCLDSGSKKVATVMVKNKRRAAGWRPSIQGGGSPPDLPGPGKVYPLALRLKVVEQASAGGVSLQRLSKTFGPSVTTILNWLDGYDEGAELAR
jgi:hypothetical protein